MLVPAHMCFYHVVRETYGTIARKIGGAKVACHCQKNDEIQVGTICVWSGKRHTITVQRFAHLRSEKNWRVGE